MVMSAFNVDASTYSSSYPLLNNHTSTPASKNSFYSSSMSNNPQYSNDYYNSYYRGTPGPSGNPAASAGINNNEASVATSHPYNNNHNLQQPPMLNYSSSFYPVNSEEPNGLVFQSQYFQAGGPPTAQSNTSYNSNFSYNTNNTTASSHPAMNLGQQQQQQQKSVESENAAYQPSAKRYSVSYPGGGNWSVNYQQPQQQQQQQPSGANNTNSNNSSSNLYGNTGAANLYSHNGQNVSSPYAENSMGQFGYLGHPQKQAVPAQYSAASNTNTPVANSTSNNHVPNPYYSFNDNYYHQNYSGQSAPNSAAVGGFRNTSENLMTELSPTVASFPQNQAQYYAHLQAQSRSAPVDRSVTHEDRIDENPIPLNFNSYPSNPYGTSNAYGSHSYYGGDRTAATDGASQAFNAQEVFRSFESRLKNSTHVKLLRTNTLPKEEISKNITVYENNNKKVYFNFEYPTVNITFQQPINNVTLNWSEIEKNNDRRKLVLFYWDFSLIKANHVINSSINRDALYSGGSNPAANSSPETTKFFNENLEYIKSILHLQYTTITEEEYQYLFEIKKPRKRDQQQAQQAQPQNLDQNKLRFLERIVRIPATNGIKNNFCIVSCLYWTHTQDFYLTSVDLLFLLDKLSGRTTNITNSISNKDVSTSPKLDVGKKSSKYASKEEVKKLKQAAKLLKLNDSKEVNRIRRNLLNFKSITLGKAEADEETVAAVGSGINASDFGTEEEMQFFHTIMGFNNPKPRKIEKKLKVYEWKILEQALDKIMKKYCVDLSR